MVFKEFVAKEGRWTLGIIIVTALIGLVLTIVIKPNPFTKVLAITVFLSIIGLGSILLALLAGLTTLGKTKGSFGNIFKTVPSNQAWVLRWLLGSDPETLNGYVDKREGLAGRIPLLQLDEGMVDLKPQIRNPEPMTVRSRDNQLIKFNYWYIWQTIDPRASKARTRDPEGLADQTILTHFAGLASQIPTGILGTISTDNFMEVFNRGYFKAMNYDRRDNDGNPLPAEEETFIEDGKNRTKAINADLEYFGLKVTKLKLEQIIPPETQVKAAEKRTEERIRKEAMAQEAEAVKHFSKEVGVSGTIGTFMHFLPSILRSIGEGFSGRKGKDKSSKSKEGSEKE